MKLSVLCYLISDGKWLLLHRCGKKKNAENDPNAGKWIGVGGKIEDGESPDEACDRECLEETGLTLLGKRLRGIITFVSDVCENEYMFLYSADGYDDEMIECDEGELHWVEGDIVPSLPTWEGDRIFLRLILQDSPFFSLKLIYRGDNLTAAYIDGKEVPI